MAGIALVGRRLLAAFVAAMLVASVMFLLAETPARANHFVPDDIVPQEQGSNQVVYWEDYLADLGIEDATCEKVDEAGDEAYELGQPPAGQVWVMLVVKQATMNYVYLDPVPNHEYPSTGDQSPGFSHAIECYGPEPDETTTTTVEDITTTTVEDITTTTVEDITTTTVEDITTTDPTTTTTIGDEVLNTTITAAPSTTVPDEVLAEELPLTGGENGRLALVAGGLGMIGALVLAATRRIEDN